MTSLTPPHTRQRVSGACLMAALSLAFGCGETVDDALGGGGGDFDAIYESAPFQECGECHAPNAPGFVAGTERTQDWSSAERAKSTLRGEASGLIGNFEGCNGVPFLGDTAETSLLVASLDEDVRASFEAPGEPDCTADAISLQTLKIQSDLSAALLQDLKDWINAGAP